MNKVTDERQNKQIALATLAKTTTFQEGLAEGFFACGEYHCRRCGREVTEDQYRSNNGFCQPEPGCDYYPISGTPIQSSNMDNYQTPTTLKSFLQEQHAGVERGSQELQ